jgi:iron complex outermembrane receptor protein
VKFTLGGNNIFNVYPDKHKHSANIDNGNFTYSRRVQQFGVNGANYYLRALIKL